MILWRRSVVVAALSAGSLLLAAPVGAQSTDSLEVTPASASAGATITVAGDGCVAGAQVELRFDGELVGDTEADSNGSFTGSLDVPAGLTAASYEVTALCGTSADASATLVGHVSVELPRTGAPSGLLATIGFGLVFVGAGLVLLATLRRRLSLAA